jgi:hypothetical protein
MDFITRLPITQKGNDSIWVIMDRLTKSAHFLSVKTTYRPLKYADIYIAEIVRLHGIPKTIVSDRGTQFTAHFWEQLHKGLGTKLVHSLAYHPQTLGQTERINQILEDMLRACALLSKGSWESWLPLAEFSYNNSYQSSIKMTPFEALYGRRCRTPLNWFEAGERRFYGNDLIAEAEEKVRIIRQNMETLQYRKKSYADQRRRPLTFQVGDFLYLKVSPMKGVQRFGAKKNLAPRYVGPYQVIERKGEVVYKIQLLEDMSTAFPVFHVSRLKKCLRIPEEKVEVKDLKIGSDLVYQEQPVEILDTKDQITRNSTVKMYKILWSHHDEHDATWETDAYLR